MTEGERIVPLVRKHADMMKAVVMFAVSIALLVFAILPLFSKATGARKELAQRRVELEELSQKVVILSSIDKQVLEERVKVLDRVLPPGKDIVAYLVTLDALTRELDLVLGGISLSPGEVSTSSAEAGEKSARVSGLSTLETEIDIAGREEDIYSFLKQIEQTAPLMKVNDVKMSRNKEGVDAFRLSLNLGMLYSEVKTIEDVKGVVSLFTDAEERMYQELVDLSKYGLVDVEDVGVYLGGAGRKDLFSSPSRLLLESSRLSSPPPVGSPSAGQ